MEELVKRTYMMSWPLLAKLDAIKLASVDKGLNLSYGAIVRMTIEIGLPLLWEKLNLTQEK